MSVKKKIKRQQAAAAAAALKSGRQPRKLRLTFQPCEPVTMPEAKEEAKVLIGVVRRMVLNAAAAGVAAGALMINRKLMAQFSHKSATK